MSGQIKKLWMNQLNVEARAAQVYTVAAFDLFDILGPVEIVKLGGYVTAAAVGATEVRITVNGVNVDAAAVAINGAVGTVVLSCLNVAGTLINAAAIPQTVATLTTMVSGQGAAAAGAITATFSVGTSWTGVWFVEYRKLSPFSSITAA